MGLGLLTEDFGCCSNVENKGIVTIMHVYF